MDISIRQAQLKVLEVFSGAAKTFALAGGTALEIFYLKHRFSKDLDFFSPKYNEKEIDNIVSQIKSKLKFRVKLENEFTGAGYARARFYSAGNKKAKLKIDFVEDVLIKKPAIRKFNKIPVYDVKNIYIQKIFAIAGTRAAKDGFGKDIATGRNEARDVFDIYTLSTRVKPLHISINSLPRIQQRQLIQWWRSFSRLDLKIGIMELEIYNKKHDVSDMLRHIDAEVNKFIIGEIDR